jgi:replicative DNA helicase
MLMDEGSCAKALQDITPKHFFKMSHATVFEAIHAIVDSGSTVDTITLTDKLKTMGKLSSVGGLSFLGDLITYADTRGDVQEYVKIVQDKYTLRNLLTACGDIMTAISRESEADDVMRFAEGRILDVIAKEVKNETHKVSDILWDAFAQLEKRMADGGVVPGVPTGFTKLDRATSGFKPGQLITLAGRPAMGKTSFALNVALNAAITHGVPTVVFSLEMSESELMERMLSSEARIDSAGLRIGKLADYEMKRLVEAAGLISEAPIFVNDSAGMTPAEMRGHIRRLQQEYDIGLVVVDYLQLMSLGDNRFTGNRVAEVSKISRDLKVLARDLEVPILALSQLNRAVENRDDKRPQLADLRESGSIEQDSDIVMFIYRPEVYEGPVNKRGENIEMDAELIIRKQRNGPTGKVSFEFYKEYTRFEEKVQDVYESAEPKQEAAKDEQIETLDF